ncbi:kelch-like protein 28 [Eupeodes corollae]|uniref:kelch-like protein 28 n=1 Tax=Eupeodes corollae TaxID=290404 RepID=UPI0024914693|nr:kelch-like protein 28 [Eupeodes corollae]
MGEEEQLVALDSNGSTMSMRIQTYNSERNNWDSKKLPEIWNDRRSFGVTLISSTMIFAGGYIFNSTPTNEVLCLNLQTMKFYENAPMLQSRIHFPLLEFKDELYAIGGLVNDQWSVLVEKYNFSTGKWKAVSSLRSLMKFPSAAVLDGYLYAIGQFAPLMECYDPSTNLWTRKAAPNSKLQYVSIIGFEGFLYAICRGYSNSICTINFERYDPSKNIWEIKQSPLFGEKCTVLRNRLFCCGLNESNESKEKEYIVEEYNVEADEWILFTSLTSMQGVYSVFTLQK